MQVIKGEKQKVILRAVGGQVDIWDQATASLIYIEVPRPQWPRKPTKYYSYYVNLSMQVIKGEKQKAILRAVGGQVDLWDQATASLIYIVVQRCTR